jgi:hypothetical protein
MQPAIGKPVVKFRQGIEKGAQDLERVIELIGFGLGLHLAHKPAHLRAHSAHWAAPWGARTLILNFRQSTWPPERKVPSKCAQTPQIRRK